jgi:uncharacterized repeat protein (TIGR03803 family)
MKKLLSRAVVMGLTLAAGGWANDALADGTVSVLHSFAPLAAAGAYPWSTLVQGGDGSFYGTASSGGAFSAGVVFRVTSGGALTPLYSFTFGNDGAIPRASLLLASDGNFYGTTSYGGSNGVGTVFRITTNGLFMALYSFRTNGIDGQRPEAALIEGTDGNFYGTASSGGSNGCGVIYRITTGGALTNLHTFSDSSQDGDEPTAPLILGTDGNFYGTTAYGGSLGAGTVFRMTPQGAVTNLYSFSYYGDDGAVPWAALVEGTDGNFYGTTYSGGPLGYGTVFMITPDGDFTPLYSFSNGADGGSPYAALVQGDNGDFYGTSHGSSTLYAGTNSIGTVFEVTPYGDLWTLYSFTNGTDGANPTAGLVLGTDGNFYGAAEAGGVIGWGGSIGSMGRIMPGTMGWGTIFTMTQDGEFTPLCEFPGESEGCNPGAGLIQATNGLLYGVTERGGTNDDGTVFQMGWDGTVTPLYSFTAGADGAVPLAALTEGSDGNFYGTSYEGGPSGVGAVFKLTPAGLLTVLHAFTNGIDGGHPMAALVQATGGNFYGTTTSGGAKNGGGGGTVFQITPAGVLTTLHAFTNGSDGTYPMAGLALGTDGQFYGAAESGGTNSNGTVFRMSPTGVLKTIYSFMGGADGATPAATLTLGPDGAFYGVCEEGGVNQYGTVFRITTSGLLTPLHSFNGTNDGGSPESPLVLGTDGKLYGTTGTGGDNYYGTVFQITTNGTFQTLHSFAWPENGPEGYSALLQATNGNFYVVCEGAGMGSGAFGTVLRLIVPPAFQSFKKTGNSATVMWAGETGQKYQVQYSSTLAPCRWTNLGAPVIAAGPLITSTNTPPAGGQGYFRVQVLP